jgi:hypothetical protein
MTRDERISKLKNGSYTAIWAANEIELLEKRLTGIDTALPAMREFAKKNPRFYDGEAWQDPCGVHAWLERYDKSYSIGSIEWRES